MASCNLTCDYVHHNNHKESFTHSNNTVQHYFFVILVKRLNLQMSTFISPINSFVFN